MTPDELIQAIKDHAKERIETAQAILEYALRRPLSDETHNKIREITQLEMKGYKDILHLIEANETREET